MDARKIHIVSNPTRDIGMEAAKRAAQLLESRGCVSRIFERMPESFAQDDYPELIVVIGGDGTIMRAARAAATLRIPILGVNCGHLGYLAELEQSEIGLIERYLSGGYTVERRMMLDVRVAGRSYLALNDAVISHGVLSRMAEIELYCGSEKVSRYHADGLIAATPTGSTAYSLSAGGPVVDPRLDCVIVTPICPHTLGAKPLIFSPDMVLRAVNAYQPRTGGESGYGDLYLTVDGIESVSLPRGAEASVTRAGITTSFIRMNRRGFYGVMSEKLSD